MNSDRFFLLLIFLSLYFYTIYFFNDNIKKINHTKNENFTPYTKKIINNYCDENYYNLVEKINNNFNHYKNKKISDIYDDLTI